MNRPAVARCEIAGLVPGCPGIEHIVKGNAKSGITGAQRGGRLCVAGGDVIQHEHIAGSILAAGSGFPGDGGLKLLDAGLDVIDQRNQLRNDGLLDIIPIGGWARSPAVCVRLHDCSPARFFMPAVLLVR